MCVCACMRAHVCVCLQEALFYVGFITTNNISYKSYFPTNIMFDNPPSIGRHTPSSHKTGKVVSQLAPQAKCLVIKSDKKGLLYAVLYTIV